MSSARVPSASNFPLGVPPVGVTPNFEHPANHDTEMTVGVAVCASLVFTFCALRAWAKFAGYMKKTWNDVVFIFAVLFTLAHIILNYILIVEGPFGKHLYDLLIDEFSKSMLLSFHANLIIWTVGVCLIKLSFMIFYLEIFGRLRWMRISAYFGMAFIILCHFPFFIAFGMLCAPKPGSSSLLMVLSSWVSPTCRNVTPRVVISQGVLDVLTDLYLFILPLPAIHSLQLPRRPKIGILAMFLTGSVACVASAMSLYYRIFVSLSWTNANWLDGPMSLVTMIEITAGIVILCMPAVVAITKKSTFSSKVRSYMSRSSSTQRGSSGAGREKSLGSSITSAESRSPMTTTVSTESDSSIHRDSLSACEEGKAASNPREMVESKTAAQQVEVHEVGVATPIRLSWSRPLSVGSLNRMFITKSLEYSVEHEV